jgi:hypothetical protein
VADPKAVVLARTPLSTPDQSQRQRTGTFTLSEDGTLEGSARIVYTGHLGQRQRTDVDHEAAAEREKNLREQLTARVPGAEISDVRIDYVTDTSQPMAVSYRVRIPGYAQRAGARLLFQAAVFQKGFDALFPSATRASRVYFPFAWSEHDHVTITLPAGFALEEPEAPPRLDAGAGDYEVAMAVKGSTLVVNRTFAFGLKNTILFEQAAYPAIKNFFDLVQASDSHALVLRRDGGAE